MIKAFRIGVDRMPSWFMEKVRAGTVQLEGREIDSRVVPVAALINCGAGYELVERGEYIVELADGGMTFCSEEVYAILFGKDKGTDQ